MTMTHKVLGENMTKQSEASLQGLREKLAAIEHERWSDWQKWVHNCGVKHPNGDITLKAVDVNRWDEQINTPYKDLTENEKDSDRDQVDRYWPLVELYCHKQVIEATEKYIVTAKKYHYTLGYGEPVIKVSEWVKYLENELTELRKTL
jgi:uncharacterized protein YecT (DUF1311 family)